MQITMVLWWRFVIKPCQFVLSNSIQKVFCFLCSVLCRWPKVQIRQSIFSTDIHKAFRKEGCFAQFICKENIITFILLCMKFQMPKEIIGARHRTAQRTNLRIGVSFPTIPIGNRRFRMIDCHFASFQINVVILRNRDFLLPLSLEADMLDFLHIFDAGKSFLPNYCQSPFWNQKGLTAEGIQEIIQSEGTW